MIGLRGQESHAEETMQGQGIFPFSLISARQIERGMAWISQLRALSVYW